MIIGLIAAALGGLLVIGFIASYLLEGLGDRGDHVDLVDRRESYVGTPPTRANSFDTGFAVEKEYNSQFDAEMKRAARSQPKVTVTRRGFCEDSTKPPKGNGRQRAKRNGGYWQQWKEQYKQAESSSFNGRWSNSSPSFTRQRSTKWASVLGVSPDASKRQIKGAYRRLAREHHPDAGGNEDDFRRIQEAYDEGMNR